VKVIHAIVRGRVQGVFFRDSTRREAINLDLTGWVRNRPDGSVEVVASGAAKNLDLFCKWLGQGPPQARVEHVELAERSEREQFETFSIRY
jgi:acylphosphatase